MRKQRRPYVIVDIVPYGGRLYLEVSNCGERSAIGVKFEIIEDIPESKGGRGVLDLKEGEPGEQKLRVRIRYNEDGTSYEEEFAHDLAPLLASLDDAFPLSRDPLHAISSTLEDLKIAVEQGLGRISKQYGVKQ